MKQVYTSDTAKSVPGAYTNAFSGIPGSYVFTNIPGKERPPIVVQHNVVNVALYCTRFKFATGWPDAWQKAVSVIEGVTEVASYQPAGLYDLTVKKATAFGWDEIEPKVLEILGRRHAELTLAEVMAKPPSPKVPIPMDTSLGKEWKSPHGAQEYVPPTDKPGQWGALHDEASRAPFMNLANDGGAGNDNGPGEVSSRPKEYYAPFKDGDEWRFRVPNSFILEGPFDTEDLARLRAGFLMAAEVTKLKEVEKSASMCDDHSWAGQGRCPHCAEAEEGR
jgi:hypothetical protein